jgi:hypothetical protein
MINLKIFNRLTKWAILKVNNAIIKYILDLNQILMLILLFL